MNAPLCVSNPGDFWNIRLVADKSTDVTVSVQSFKFDTVNYIEPILDHMSIRRSELYAVENLRVDTKDSCSCPDSINRKGQAD